MALSRVSAPLILTERSGRLTTALRYVVTVVCAASAGIHAALVQPQVDEAGQLVGVAFAAASLALAAAALAVRQPRHDAWAPIAAAIVLSLIAVGYLLSRTTGIPLLITDREELDPLDVFTTGAELIGALAAAVLIRNEGDRMTFPMVSSRRRAVPLAVVVLAAVAAALLTVTTSSESAHASPADHEHGNSQFLPLRTSAQVSFHDQMRKLWEDHVTWTRLAIVTFADGSKGFSATATRLLQNQTDIGNAITPFYGIAAGNQLSALLHDHITIAVEILQAAKAGDTAAFAEAKTRWYGNANDIADFLAAANPPFWPQDAMRAAMREHLDQTLTEASDELSGNFTASVADYETVHLHILAMADRLSSGIMRQFPGQFH